MYIFLSIMAFLFLLIAIILLLPFYITLKNGQDNKPIFEVKFLSILVSNDKNSDHFFAKLFKSRDNTKEEAKDEEKKNKKLNISEVFNLVIAVLKEIVKLFKHCKAKKIEVNVVCASDDAADSAIKYGACCAVLYPALSIIDTLLKSKPKNRQIDISCDFNETKDKIEYNLTISVRVFRLVVAALNVILAEIKRKTKKQ